MTSTYSPIANAENLLRFLLEKMKKNISKSLSRFLLAGRLFLSLALLAQQSSAYAFLENPISTAPASGASIQKGFQNFSEVTNKGFIQALLSKPTPVENQFQPTLSDAFRAIVGIYTYENKYRKFSRIVFNNPENQNANPYLAYEVLPNGSLGRLLESGTREGKQFIRERIYDPKSKTVTLYNRENIFEKRIFEWTENGQLGKPIQFRGRLQNGNLINLVFRYKANTVTCIYLHGMTFATYEMNEPGVLGKLLEMGSVASSRTVQTLELKNRIKITTLERQGTQIPVYEFQGPNQSIVIRERLCQDGIELGPMGRVLRYKAEGVDLEYFYQDSEALLSRVWIYNHISSESFGFEISKKDLAETAGRFGRTDQKDQGDIFLGTSFSKSLAMPKSILVSKQAGLKVVSVSSDELPGSLILERLLRGPPKVNPKVIELFRPLCFHFLLSFYSPSYIYSFFEVLA